MRKEFIVERQGRSFCLYAGLLDLAHQQGLKSIRTELIQAPTDANNRIAICSATVIVEANGVERQFTGIGDAAPNNVAPAMQTCLLRMAETRAKARALRDAVNIGVAAFEELGEEDAHDGAPERGYAIGPPRGIKPERGPMPPRANGAAAPPRKPEPTPRPQQLAESVAEPAAAPPASETRNPSADAVTNTQIDAIRKLSERQSTDPDQLAKERFSVATVSELTHSQAGELIRDLNGKPGARVTTAA